jgi:hypothetical protein
LPPWVCEGLASYVAEQGMPPQTGDSPEQPAGVKLGGQQWRWKRATEDTLEAPQGEMSQAAAQVKFLLEGNDAAHTFEFFQAAKQAIDTEIGHSRQETRNSYRRGEAQPSTLHGAVDDLADATQEEFLAWQQDRQIGQPLLPPQPKAAPERIELERQMVFVLKLLRRFPAETVTKTRMAIHEFGAPRQPAAVAATPVQPIDLEKLWTRLTDPSAGPWATLDPDGKLLLSTEAARLRELLGLDERRFQVQRRGKRTSLIARLDEHVVLQGWLQDNRANPLRPLAQFDTIESQGKATERPQPGQQARGR